MKMRKKVVAGAILGLSVFSVTDEAWSKPVIVPVPDRVEGLKEHRISLNGTWKFTLNPPEAFWKNAVDLSDWNDIKVPGEPWMQGLEIKRDIEYPYKKQIKIPDDFKGQRILLRFDGVYSAGRVWVNGNFAGEHYGGFTSWNLDITEFVVPGEPAWITVGITDLADDLSFASGYASRYYTDDFDHFIGGILRDVTLFAVPEVCVASLHYVTDLDNQYKNTDFEIKLELVNNGNEDKEYFLRYSLLDPLGSDKTVWRHETSTGKIKPSEKNIETHETKIKNPLLWDAEHPNLYTLKVDLTVDGKLVEVLSRKVGFREIELKDGRVLVNGKEVKLRGGCRHSVHPLTGRSDMPEFDEKDVLLYKEANINYIRTSHYPCTERFLEMCDKYGIYVEEEMAIVWLDHHAAKGKLDDRHSDPEYLPYFIRQISEALERDKSHPSVIIWSLGNENCKWGENFEKERDYARQEDPTRLLKTGHNHYSEGWNTDEHLDLDSYHYPLWNSNFNKDGKPFLFDEYVHVICYYKSNFNAEWDPNVRNFWGESIKKFWDGMFPAKGTLGGAIWGTVDDVFLSPNRVNGYGRWGIFDGWRRKKPEFWHAKKAYSPVRIENKPLGNPGEEVPLRIPVENRFDHTDFSELEILWSVNGRSWRLETTLAPHEKGNLVIPAGQWKDEDVLNLKFFSNHHSLRLMIDEYSLPLMEKSVRFDGISGPCPNLSETDDEIMVEGEDFRVVFDRQKGCVKTGEYRGRSVIIGGPVLNLYPYELMIFKLSEMRCSRDGDHITVDITGSYGVIKVAYNIRIYGNGLLETTYRVDNPPEKASQYNEVGVAFILSDDIDALEWERQGLWSVYPEDHIGRNKGVALKKREGAVLKYREEPAWSWSVDMEDFHAGGKDHKGYGLTHDFRSSKEYIYYASVFNQKSGQGVRVESDGKTHAVRLQKADQIMNRIDDRDSAIVYMGDWTDYSDSSDFCGTEKYSDKAGDSFEYSFQGTSIAWITAMNNNLGKADVYLDGELAAEGVDCYASRKKHQQILFSRSGLKDDRHTIRIVVKGEKNPGSSDSFIISDGFSDVVDSDNSPGIRMNINREWAYNLGWGNYDRTSKISSGFADTVRIRFVGWGGQ